MTSIPYYRKEREEKRKARLIYEEAYREAQVAKEYVEQTREIHQEALDRQQEAMDFKLKTWLAWRAEGN